MKEQNKGTDVGHNKGRRERNNVYKEERIETNKNKTRSTQEDKEDKQVKTFFHPFVCCSHTFTSSK